jgi:tetratricopeptide (TPR) repeat protein
VLGVAALCFAVLGVFGPATLARAQATRSPGVTSTDEEGRLLFEAGSRAFNDARYDVALERFREAYEMSHRPVLLFNIGTAADRLRKDAEALEAFVAYLAAVPDAPNRRDVEARITALRRAVEERAALETQARANAAATTPVNPGGDSAAGPAGLRSAPGETARPAWAGWLALGGVAVAVAGVVPAAMSMSTQADLDARCNEAFVCPRDAKPTVDRGASQALAADVLFATGGALALGFGLVWLLGGEPSDATPALGAWCDGEGCNVRARGHF